jgi:hypothetical protein
MVPPRLKMTLTESQQSLTGDMPGDRRSSSGVVGDHTMLDHACNGSYSMHAYTYLDSSSTKKEGKHLLLGISDGAGLCDQHGAAWSLMEVCCVVFFFFSFDSSSSLL